MPPSPVSNQEVKKGLKANHKSNCHAHIKPIHFLARPCSNTSVPLIMNSPASFQQWLCCT